MTHTKARRFRPGKIAAGLAETYQPQDLVPPLPGAGYDPTAPTVDLTDPAYLALEAELVNAFEAMVDRLDGTADDPEPEPPAPTTLEDELAAVNAAFWAATAETRQVQAETQAILDTLTGQDDDPDPEPTSPESILPPLSPEEEEATAEECRLLNLEAALEYRMRQRDQGAVEEDCPEDILEWVEALLAGADQPEDITFVFALSELESLCAPCRCCHWVRPWHRLVAGCCEECQQPEPPIASLPVQANQEDEQAACLALYDAWEAQQEAAAYAAEQDLPAVFQGIERWLLALEHRSIARQAEAERESFWRDYAAALPGILNRMDAWFAGVLEEDLCRYCQSEIAIAAFGYEFCSEACWKRWLEPALPLGAWDEWLPEGMSPAQRDEQEAEQEEADEEQLEWEAHLRDEQNLGGRMIDCDRGWNAREVA